MATRTRRNENDSSAPVVWDNTKKIVDTSLYGIVGTSITFPIVLDLNNNNQFDIRGLPAEETPPNGNILFDWDGDDVLDPTAWVGPGDGLLAIDLGTSGDDGPDDNIDQAKELAFTSWIDGAEDDPLMTDLDALRLVFDTNHDNILSALDDRWSEFRVWQDTNQNGISDAGELKTMSEAGITLINLTPSTDSAQMLADGSMIMGTSAYQTTDGKQHMVADTALAWRPSDALASA